MINFKLTSYLPLALSACLITGSLVGPTVQANDGVLSDANVSRAGLVVDWFTQVEVAAGGHLVDIQMTIDENSTTTLFNITYGNHNFTAISPDVVTNRASWRAVFTGID